MLIALQTVRQHESFSVAFGLFEHQASTLLSHRVSDVLPRGAYPTARDGCNYGTPNYPMSNRYDAVRKEYVLSSPLHDVVSDLGRGREREEG